MTRNPTSTPRAPVSVLARAVAGPIALALLLAACGSSPGGSTTSGTNGKSGSKVVALMLTDKGCDPSKLTLPAGPTTFDVTNTGSGAVTEVEIMKGSSIIGEVENIAPGLKGSFSLTLEPGMFAINCPGGSDTTKGTLVVTGSTSATTSSAGADQAVATYRTYLEQQTNQLVTTTRPFVDAVVAGNVAPAQQLYPQARPYYEAVEPVAETFGDLDPEIDAREGDPLPTGQTWGGFHRIEKALWQDGSTDGMAPVAQKLLTDVTDLQRKVETVELEPATIANGAVELLNEVSTSKITGEEERYSHLDLVDFQANVDGSQAAFEAVKPLLAAKDASLAAEITQRFADVNAALATYRVGSNHYSFVLYTQLRPEDTKKLSAAVDALAEPLSQVAKQVVS
jgi:iron uptake system component EfeO